MNLSTSVFSNERSAGRKHFESQRAGVRVVLLPLLFLLLGVGVGALLFYHRSASTRPAAGPGVKSAHSITLSKSTRDVLSRLKSPVQIRFYSMLDPQAAGPALVAFADRVGRLLSAFEQQSDGMITVTRFSSFSPALADQAQAEGITPFNLGKGNGCYLGIVVACNDHHETLGRLSPDWEPALEFDVSRAIEKVSRAPKPARRKAARPPAKTTVIDEVKRQIPNLNSVSIEEGTRILRESALKKYEAAAKQFQAEVKQAQQELADARNGKSAVEQQAAMKHFQQVRAEQSAKLKQIAADFQAELEALKQLKTPATAP